MTKKTYTTTGAVYLGLRDDDVTEYFVRYTFTVDPGRPQSYGQPAEPVTVDDIKIKVCLSGKYHDCPDVLYDMIVADNCEVLEAWLLECAETQERNDQEEAADHRLRILKETA